MQLRSKSGFFYSLVSLLLMRFDIFNGSVLVGWSELERGDAPMGCASGRFHPESGYSAIRAYVVSTLNTVQDQLRLTVRTNDGEMLDPIGGVRISDLSAEPGEVEGLEVDVVGISYPTYERLFSNHVQAYDEQFKAG